MRIILSLSAVLLFALVPALAAAQDPPAVQEPQILQPASPPPPTVVYYVPYFVPYPVFVPATPRAGKLALVHQQPGFPPQPSFPPPLAVGMLSGPPVSATGVFAGNPATGVFAGNPATGIFAVPPRR